MAEDRNFRYRFTERVVDSKPLGRHVNHDPRSKSYPHLASPRTVLRPVRHIRHIDVLDQGNLRSCTGNAAVGALGTDPVFGGLQPADGPLIEPFAVDIYSAATKIDDYPGTYPPTDTGSDGLSVAKVCKARGYINGYRHAFTITDALDALQEGPVITGVSWHTGMDTPDSRGLVNIGGVIRGGHEFVVDEFVPAGFGTITGDVFTFDAVGFANSWGPSYGIDGRGYISTEDWAELLHDQGDVTVFVANGEPAPTPVDAPFPGATARATANVLRLAAHHHMTPTDYLNWRYR